VSIPESHLAQEAIAALVDGELPAGPASRAARHLSGCMQCRLAVQAQREAKEALNASADVSVPGDLMSRLCAIPFTTDVPTGGGGLGAIAAGPDQLTDSGPSGSFAVDLAPQRHPQRADHARWLRRGLAGTLAGLGVGVTALALNLPADATPGTPTPGGGAVAGQSLPDRHTDVMPPVLRTVNIRPSSALSGQGGTP
jgi:anti-sigma factor RsiW